MTPQIETAIVDLRARTFAALDLATCAPAASGEEAQVIDSLQRIAYMLGSLEERAAAV